MLHIILLYAHKIHKNDSSKFTIVWRLQRICRVWLGKTDHGAKPIKFSFWHIMNIILKEIQHKRCLCIPILHKSSQGWLIFPTIQLLGTLADQGVYLNWGIDYTLIGVFTIKCYLRISQNIGAFYKFHTKFFINK